MPELEELHSDIFPFSKQYITLEQDKPEVRSKRLDKWQPDPVAQKRMG